MLADVTTSWLRGLNPLDSTISRAAKGDYAFIMDGGIILFATGAVALALALTDVQRRGSRARWGAAMLVIIAAAALVLAVWNGYGRKHADDFGLHMVAVYVLAAAFPIAAGLLAEGLTALRSWAGRFSLLIATVWIALGPANLFASETFEGLFERAALLVLMVWFVVVSVLIWGAAGRIDGSASNAVFAGAQSPANERTAP